MQHFNCTRNYQRLTSIVSQGPQAENLSTKHGPIRKGQHIDSSTDKGFHVMSAESIRPVIGILSSNWWARTPECIRASGIPV